MPSFTSSLHGTEANAISDATVVFAGTSPNPVMVWGGNTWSNNVQLLPIQNGYVVVKPPTGTMFLFRLPPYAVSPTAQAVWDHSGQLVPADKTRR